ncbi:MAG: 3-phosphoshikimate 1-carboxyvinyltransferase [Ruminococcaceae bacterium]|nr:3-phosphoshikimate 1-carboxyvinyltransferase [Oscillospiraceae bacterium]
MDILISPGKLSGHIAAIPSKSQAHRLLICAAFANGETELLCPDTNRDIEATAACLRALGADILRTDTGYRVLPIRNTPQSADLPCGESGSTLRFFLPIAAALGVRARFHMEGRLAQRPLSPLWEEMEAHGCTLHFIDNNTLLCEGQLTPGVFTIDGGVSSQFITGLLFAVSLLERSSQIVVTGHLESQPYVAMTQEAMALFGVKTENFSIKSGQKYHSPEKIAIEGDWSNSTFWLAANALGSAVSVSGLDSNSPQGDRAAAHWLPRLTEHCQISAGDIPDLVPILSVVAACHQGAEFTDIRRLRLKESDRVAAVIAMIEALGGKAQATENTLTIFSTGLVGGVVDAMNDHRIAMASAIAATACSQPVTIRGAECVAKSYPKFWEDYKLLGGQYEQHLR